MDVDIWKLVSYDFGIKRIEYLVMILMLDDEDEEDFDDEGGVLGV